MSMSFFIIIIFFFFSPILFIFVQIDSLGHDIFLHQYCMQYLFSFDIRGTMTSQLYNIMAWKVALGFCNIYNFLFSMYFFRSLNHQNIMEKVYSMVYLLPRIMKDIFSIQIV
jgi:hypothetical protein